jgi:predicted nucleotidyltransferase
LLKAHLEDQVPDTRAFSNRAKRKQMQVDLLVQEIVQRVKQVTGVKAVVLGGSRSRGADTLTSDIDLGIYYHPDVPLDLEELGRVATHLDDQHRPDVITGIGGWGPWINGGGWLRIQSQPVDFLYRDLGKVTRVIEDCLHGKVEIFYQPGHPLGFVSSMYLAEVAVCRPLWDPEGILSALKKKIDPYPDPLQKALIQKFGWEIRFSIDIARKSAARSDVTYAAGCCFRSVMCMLQVLFAINKTHWLNEKGAVALADTFTQKPERLQARINETFRLLDANPQSIQQAIAHLEEMSNDIDTLVALFSE